MRNRTSECRQGRIILRLRSGYDTTPGRSDNSPGAALGAPHQQIELSGYASGSSSSAFVAASVPWSTWSSRPGLNRTARPGSIETSRPVRGFRPIPVLRGRIENTPKPRNSMRSPSTNARFMLRNTASTACSARTRGTPRSTTRCTRSCLITVVAPFAYRREPVP